MLGAKNWIDLKKTHPRKPNIILDEQKKQIESRQSDIKISSFRFFIAAEKKIMKRISVHIDTHKTDGWKNIIRLKQK